MKILPKGEVPLPTEEDVHVHCTFCPGYWETRQNDGALIHSNPPCREYVEMEVDDFMKATRLKMGISDLPEANN